MVSLNSSFSNTHKGAAKKKSLIISVAYIVGNYEREFGVLWVFFFFFICSMLYLWYTCVWNTKERGLYSCMNECYNVPQAFCQHPSFQEMFLLFSADGSFPMSQRSFPPSFWNSTYQPSVTASLSSALGASHSELPFPADPYSTASLHSHLHQATPEPWHPSHHHHHHPYSLGGAISTQGSAYPRPGMHEVYGTHFDPRYGSLLVPSVRPHRLPPASVPAPGASPCDISKSEPASSTWTGAFTGTGSEMNQSLSLNVDAGNTEAD